MVWSMVLRMQHDGSASKGTPAIARSYWDAFGFGTLLAVALIVLGSAWSLFTGIRARRAEVGEG